MYEDVLEDRVEQECRSLRNRLNRQKWFRKCETLSCFDGHMHAFMFRIVRRLLANFNSGVDFLTCFFCMCLLCVCHGKSDDRINGGLQFDNWGEWVNKL
jgi:hypothetical protein